MTKGGSRYISKWTGEREESLNYPTSEILKRIERYVKYLRRAGYRESGTSGSERGSGKPVRKDIGAYCSLLYISFLVTVLVTVYPSGFGVVMWLDIIFRSCICSPGGLVTRR
jgi:hypothetical protein